MGLIGTQRSQRAKVILTVTLNAASSLNYNYNFHHQLRWLFLLMISPPTLKKKEVIQEFVSQGIQGYHLLKAENG